MAACATTSTEPYCTAPSRADTQVLFNLLIIKNMLMREMWCPGVSLMWVEGASFERGKESRRPAKGMMYQTPCSFIYLTNDRLG